MKKVQLGNRSPIAVLAIIAIAFFQIVGCGDGGDGGHIDQGHLAGLCGELTEAFCNRSVECDIVPSFSECMETAEEEIVPLDLDCDNVVEGPTFDECIIGLAEFNCVDKALPETCVAVALLVHHPPLGACVVCQEEDCSGGLECSECLVGCMGEVKRCADPNFFIECEDGIF